MSVEKRQSLVAVFFGLSLVAVLSVVPAAAQDTTPSDDEVNSIARQLYCPVCENVPLDVCPTAACEQWRQVIRDKLSQGWSEEEVKAYFVAQYGDRVSATPPASGFNWLVYVLPPLVFLIGAAVLLRLFQAWRKPAQASRLAQEPGEEDPYVARLEEELRRFDA
jgi:cytochrome c-type biogenesis protein CcmH